MGVSAAAQSARATRNYWTPARMRHARPLELAQPADVAPEGFADRPVGEPGSVPGSGPRRPAAVVDSVAQAQAYDYPYPFTRYKLPYALRHAFPYRSIGKIFFTLHGFDFVCSGSSVAGEPRQVVFTAGHCVNDGNGIFAEHVVFVPGYRKGLAPYGVFPAKHIWTTAEWNSGLGLAFRNDVAAFNVGRNARGQRLRSRVGYLGFAWNQIAANGPASRDLHWDAFGYPAGAPFNGRHLIVCEASHAVDDTITPGVGPDPIGIGCDMTGGSSGGPWILGLRTSDLITASIPPSTAASRWRCSPRTSTTRRTPFVVRPRPTARRHPQPVRHALGEPGCLGYNLASRAASSAG